VSRRLSIGDVRAILAKLPDRSDIVLVGGQALNFWAEALAIADARSTGAFGPALSEDIDFLGPPAAALAFAEATGGNVKLPRFDDAASPNTGLVTLDIDGEPHVVDFLGGLQGFSFRELEELRRFALPVGRYVEGLPQMVVMHPVHCLQSQLENVYGRALDRRAEPGGERYIGRIRLAIEACRRITERYLAAGDPRSALKVAEKVHALSLLQAALRAQAEDGVRVDEGILDSPAMPREFLEKRLPQFRRICERRLKTFRPERPRPSR